MSDISKPSAPSTSNPTASQTGATTTGPTTRGQHRRNAAEQDAIDDSEQTNVEVPNKSKETLFKGRVDGMDGNVFQLPEENRKGNQYTKTLQALQDYVGITLERAEDLEPLFESPPEAIEIPEPEDQPPLDENNVRVTRDHRLYIDWKFDCEEYNACNKELKKNMKRLFTMILYQCSESVKTKLKSIRGYEAAKKKEDCQWILTELRNICHRFEHTENRFSALVTAKAAIFSYKQKTDQDTSDYYDAFIELVAVLEAYGGKLHDPEEAAPDSLDLTLLSITERDEVMRDRYCAMLFIKNSDDSRYGQLKYELSTDFSKGRDEYPTSLSDAHQVLLVNKGGPHISLAPTSTTTRRRNNRNNRNRGQRSQQPTTTTTQPTTATTNAAPTPGAKSFVQVGLSLAQVDDHFPNGIPNHYILLDSDSTVSIFCNADLLSDIHNVTDPLILATNGGGHKVCTQMGTLEGFGLVWFNADSIANVLSLAQVRKVRRVTLDTAVSPTFHVHKLDGNGSTPFIEHASGLYLYDATIPNSSTVTDTITNPVIAYSCLQTVTENKTKFTNRQIESADNARRLYRMLGRPGYSRFLDALRDNHILNCPITVDDAHRAELIYGKDVAFLKGKTTASPPKDHIDDFEAIPLPIDLLSLHPNVTLCVDIFYVLGQGFYLSTSRNIHFLSCRAIPDRSKQTLTMCLKSDIALYSARGFTPTTVHADGEFQAIASSFPAINFQICAVDDHVPEIERSIRTVKEYIRANIHGMPYHHLPRTLVKELILPHPDGVSATLFPHTIITGSPKPDFRCLSLEFGTFVQVYDGTSNDTKSRTLGAIATNPTGNSSGDYYFMSLATGHRIHSRSWTVLPISDTVISRVAVIALAEGMPTLDRTATLTEYDPDLLVDPDTYDRDFIAPTAPDADSDHNMTTDAYTDTSDDDDYSTDDAGHHPDFDDDAPLITHTLPTAAAAEERTDIIVQTTITQTPNEVGGPGHILLNNVEEPTTHAPNDVGAPVTPEPDEVGPNPPPNDVGQTNHPNDVGNNDGKNEERKAIENEERNTNDTPEHETVKNEERSGDTASSTPKRSGLRPKRRVNYKKRYGLTQVDNGKPSWETTWNALNNMPPPTNNSDNNYSGTTPNNIRKAITGLIFIQMSAHKGIKKHGQTALDALKREFLQFKAMDVLEPLDAFKLTDEQKSESLRALCVIKEKRDGTLKGRTCADGSKQQGKYSAAETGSPTISNDALFLSIMIDAFEGRDVATADIAGAYLHAHMKDFITMRFVGWAVDLLCEVNPEYEPYVVYEGKTKVIYTRCNKAIYGCVVSGVLWYELFSTTLQGLGFMSNPYDFCIANATIEGSQCTIGWFVDDTKISHKNPQVVTNIINTLEDKFGKMKVTRGSSHKFLGMNIDYCGDGTAKIHMPSYINEAITESGLDVTGFSPSPCTSSLFVLDPSAEALSPDRAKIFHSIVAKLIYVGTRARTDILLALSFLCGRVASPTTQDEHKLCRLLRYLSGTINMPLRIGADSLNHFMTWVDASFAVHPDMRSHTGGVISFGRGGLICKSKRQHINTKSSIEAELVGASDYLPHTLYVKYFMEAQGYNIDKATFYQDNESAIKMETNGKASCGQRSRHIDIRYFFITDQCQGKNISITHCPTNDMLADFFTKPLQGSLFHRFRLVLLGELHSNSLSSNSPMLPTEERVEGKSNPMNLTSEINYRDTKFSDKENIIFNVKNDTSHSIEKYPEI